MSQMNLNNLQMSENNNVRIDLVPVLVVILETLSITESAKRLGVTQSAVSHSLKKLRHQLNDDLVIREGNRLTPTAKAEQIFPRLKKWLGELQPIVDATEFSPATSQRVVYLSCTDIVERMFMPKIVTLLRHQAPGISVRFVRWNGSTVHNQLTNSDIDFAIGIRALDYSNLKHRVLYRDNFTCAARTHHPIFKTQITLDDFLSFAHTMTSSGDRQRGVVDQALDKLNRKRALTHTVSNFSSAPQMIENSDCLLTAPRFFLESSAETHDIETFEPPLVLPSFDVKLFWSRKNHQDDGSMWMRDLIATGFEQTLAERG